MHSALEMTYIAPLVGECICQEWHAFRPSKDLLIPVTLSMLFVLSALCLPLAHGKTFGGDEGMELEKAALVANGFPLYSQIWSDQPPAYTYVLAGLLKTTGMSCFLPRLFSVLTGAGLIFFISCIAQWQAGPVAGLLAGVFFASVPASLGLACAAMQEIPTAFVGLASVVCGLADRAILRRWAAPVIGAVALHFKLTAVLFLPALAAGLLWKEWSCIRDRRALVKMMLRTLMLLVLTWLLVSAILGIGSVRQMLGTHLAYSAAHNEQIKQMTIEVNRDMYPIIDLFVGGVLALLFVYRRHFNAVKVSTLVLLVCQVVFCMLYRPWWPFYVVALSVPLSVMTAVGIVTVLRDGFDSRNCSGRGRRLWKAAFATVWLVYALGLALLRWSDQYASLMRVPDARRDPALVAIQGRTKGLEWIYSQDEILAFHARMLLPPELAVTSLKRLWSGQIRKEDIPGILQDRKVTLALLLNDAVPTTGAALEKLGFEQCYQDNNYTLFER